MYFNYLITYINTPSMTSNVSKQSIWNTYVIISQWYRIKLSLWLFNHIILNARDLKWHVPRLTSQTHFWNRLRSSFPIYFCLMIPILIFHYLFIFLFFSWSFFPLLTLTIWRHEVQCSWILRPKICLHLSTFEWYLCISL